MKNSTELKAETIAAFKSAIIANDAAEVSKLLNEADKDMKTTLLASYDILSHGIFASHDIFDSHDTLDNPVVYSPLAYVAKVQNHDVLKILELLKILLPATNSLTEKDDKKMTAIEHAIINLLDMKEFLTSDQVDKDLTPIIKTLFDAADEDTKTSIIKLNIYRIFKWAVQNQQVEFTEQLLETADEDTRQAMLQDSREEVFVTASEMFNTEMLKTLLAAANDKIKNSIIFGGPVLMILLQKIKTYEVKAVEEMVEHLVDVACSLDNKNNNNETKKKILEMNNHQIIREYGMKNPFNLNKILLLSSQAGVVLPDDIQEEIKNNSRNKAFNDLAGTNSVADLSEENPVADLSEENPVADLSEEDESFLKILRANYTSISQKLFISKQGEEKQNKTIAEEIEAISKEIEAISKEIESISEEITSDPSKINDLEKLKEEKEEKEREEKKYKQLHKEIIEFTRLIGDSAINLNRIVQDETPKITRTDDIISKTQKALINTLITMEVNKDPEKKRNPFLLIKGNAAIKAIANVISDPNNQKLFKDHAKLIHALRCKDLEKDKEDPSEIPKEKNDLIELAKVFEQNIAQSITLQLNKNLILKELPQIGLRKEDVFKNITNLIIGAMKSSGCLPSLEMKAPTAKGNDDQMDLDNTPKDFSNDTSRDFTKINLNSSNRKKRPLEEDGKSETSPSSKFSTTHAKNVVATSAQNKTTSDGSKSGLAAGLTY